MTPMRSPFLWSVTAAVGKTLSALTETKEATTLDEFTRTL